MKKLADKIMNKIRSMNLSKKILISLNYESLISELCEKLDNKGIAKGDNFYILMDFIIQNYTDLDYQKSGYLWYCHTENDYNALNEAIDYISDFNYQMAKYFDEDID